MICVDKIRRHTCHRGRGGSVKGVPFSRLGALPRILCAREMQEREDPGGH